jgi:hydroxymethylglutaryl-CoA reductase
MAKTSQLEGFYKLSPEERLKIVKEFANLNDEEMEVIKSTGSLKLDQANRMIENVIGTIGIPLGIAVNFLINGRDYLIPMAIEEPSVIAAASNAARMARVKGGFRTSSTEPIMIGQIQLMGLKNASKAKKSILSNKEKIIDIANQQDQMLVKIGGGAKDIEVRILETPSGPMEIVHLLVDTRDAMGANVVNTMAEAVAPFLEEVTGGSVNLRIVSNFADMRLARAEAIFDKQVLGGERVVDGIIDAYEFADSDPYRCTTHNKGIMNGIAAVTLATGNDTRAIEAGAHAFAAKKGGYKPLSTWEKTSEGDLLGRIELPMAVGTIGGATAVHPMAKVCLKILGVKTARELGEVMAAVGLAQNLAALRAMVTEGIQKGHMKLHARNIAVMAGAEGALIDQVAERLIKERKVRVDRAKEILDELK